MSRVWIHTSNRKNKKKKRKVVKASRRKNR